jgi:hypothetical protein
VTLREGGEGREPTSQRGPAGLIASGISPSNRLIARSAHLQAHVLEGG